MPSTGFYLFLQYLVYYYKENISCVNALNGLLLISSNVKDVIDIVSNVSMPSTGFYLFLQRGNFMETTNFKVSMPSTGFYLFLQCLMDRLSIASTSTVSMPSTGFYLFLPFGDEAKGIAQSVSMPSTGFYLFLQTNHKRAG